MKFAIAFLAVNALCAFASPAPHPLLPSPSQQSFIDIAVCESQEIKIRNNLYASLFETSEQYYYKEKCRFLSTYSYYPDDFGYNLDDNSYMLPQYDAYIFGSGEAVLSSLESLVSQGLKVAIFNQGYLAPQEAYSMQQRISLYEKYTFSYKGYYQGSQRYTNMYSANIFGGFSFLDNNAWVPVPYSVFNDYSSINDIFTSSYVSERFQSMEHYYSSSSYSSNAYGSSFSSSSSSSSMQYSNWQTYYGQQGYIDLYNSYQSSISTQLIQNMATELKYNAFNVNEFGQGLNIVPIIGNQGIPTPYPNLIFKKLSSYISQIHLYTGVKVNTFSLTNQAISQFEILTASGMSRSISIDSGKVVFGMGSMSMYQLLTRSGYGSQSVLSPLGIQPALPSLPYNYNFGNVYVPQMYPGLYATFPKNSILGPYANSLGNRYLTGDYSLSSLTELSYYQLQLAVNGFSTSNVRVSFRVFNQYTSEYFYSVSKYIYQFEDYYHSYVSSLFEEYDVMFFEIELLDIRTRHQLYFKSIEEMYIDYNFYGNSYELESMYATIEIIQNFFSTGAFSSYGAKIGQLPLQNMQVGSPLSQAYNQASLLYHTVPYGRVYGGFNYAMNSQSGFVDKYFNSFDISNLKVIGDSIINSPIYGSFNSFHSIMGDYFAQNWSQSYMASSSMSSSSSSSSSISSGGIVSPGGPIIPGSVGPYVPGGPGPVIPSGPGSMIPAGPGPAIPGGPIISPGLGGSSISSSSSNLATSSMSSSDMSSSSYINGLNGGYSSSSQQYGSELATSSASGSSSSYAAGGAGGYMAGESQSMDASNSYQSSNYNSNSYMDANGNYMQSSEQSQVQQESSVSSDYSSSTVAAY